MLLALKRKKCLGLQFYAVGTVAGVVLSMLNGALVESAMVFIGVKSGLPYSSVPYAPMNS